MTGTSSRTGRSGYRQQIGDARDRWDAIRKAVQAKDDPADLINVVLEELVRARCELAGYTTLDAMAAAIRAEVNNGF